MRVIYIEKFASVYQNHNQNLSHQNWDQIRDCHHQEASSDSPKVIHGVAFAEI